jgi:regulator of ribonuclease activity B
MQSALNPEAIDAQAEKLIHLAEKFDIIYDGWGTYYEHPYDSEEGDEPYDSDEE